MNVLKVVKCLNSTFFSIRNRINLNTNIDLVIKIIQLLESCMLYTSPEKCFLSVCVCVSACLTLLIIFHTHQVQFFWFCFVFGTKDSLSKLPSGDIKIIYTLTLNLAIRHPSSPPTQMTNLPYCT